MSTANQGKAQISNDTIISFVAERAFDVSGVYAMGMNISAASLTKNILGYDKKTLGVRVSYDEERGYTIDINLIAVYGTNIPETAWNVQKNIYDGLKEEYDIVPSDINIHIQGVHEQ